MQVRPGPRPAQIGRTHFVERAEDVAVAQQELLHRHDDGGYHPRNRPRTRVNPTVDHVVAGTDAVELNVLDERILRFVGNADRTCQRTVGEAAHLPEKATIRYGISRELTQ